jgi:hypothetical protein
LGNPEGGAQSCSRTGKGCFRRRKAKRFSGVDEGRKRYLELSQIGIWSNAADPEFPPILMAAFLTGRSI